MIRYLITGGHAADDEGRWLSHVARWIEQGVDFIQIRERGLEVRVLAELTRRVVAIRGGGHPRILVNDRADVAVAAGADGVHLRDGSVSPIVFAKPGFIVSASCHDPVAADLLPGADLILLAPVFSPGSKPSERPGLGLAGIREAAGRTAVPIIALGGITLENQQACVDAGAAGVAGITYFG